MRMKELKAQNYYDVRKLDISFSSQENIIFVFEPYDEMLDELPFGDTFLDLTKFLFFNDSYTYAKNTVRKDTVIECMVEKDGVDYTFGGKGNYRRMVKNDKVCLSKTLDWFCIIPEKVTQGQEGRRLEMQLSCEPQEYFYPKVLEDFSRFNKDTYADSPTDFSYGKAFSWLKLIAKYNKRQVDLEDKLQALINYFNKIKINEHISVGLNEEKEYALFFDGEAVPEEMTSEEEDWLVNFCGWINNLNILKELCAYVGEEGNFPVFMDNAFDGALSEHKDVLIERLRETGRQVFIFSKKRDKEMEKLCDKLIEIKQN